MATATKPRKRKPIQTTEDAEPILNIPVQFGGVSAKGGIGKLPIKIMRGVMTLDEADSTFTGHRLIGRVLTGDADLDQTHFNGMERLEIRAAFDANGVSSRPKFLSTRLSFSLADVDADQFLHFESETGRLVVEKVAAIPKAGGGDAPGQTTFIAEGDWREHPVSKLGLSTGIVAKLAESGIGNVGSIKEWTDAKKKLTEIEGIGPGKAEEIQAALVKFWAANELENDDEDGSK